MKCILNMRKPIVTMVVVAILLVLFSSPLIAATNVPHLMSCCMTEAPQCVYDVDAEVAAKECVPTETLSCCTLYREIDCCVGYIEASVFVEDLASMEELPCCDADAGGCCFVLYPPPVYEFTFASPLMADAVCVEHFNFRDICDFIFEPPKV